MRIKTLLNALHNYNKRHPQKMGGFHKLVLYADESGFILNADGEKLLQFDTINQCMESLKQ